MCKPILRLYIMPFLSEMVFKEVAVMIAMIQNLIMPKGHVHIKMQTVT